MNKKIYLVRHCQAESQNFDAPLTPLGFQQSEKLCDFFTNISVDRIISSPFLRAIQSGESISQKKELKLEIDQRLSERILSGNPLSDWLDKLKLTFQDLDVTFDGGESSRAAKERVLELVEEVLHSDYRNTLLISHGNLLSLLMQHYDEHFGFEQWQKMTNPDVYVLTYNNQRIRIERVWKKIAILYKC